MDEDYYKISLVRDYYENLVKLVQNTEKKKFRFEPRQTFFAFGALQQICSPKTV